MQETYNAGWYSSNEVSSWPFINTLHANDGKTLPNSIISDIHIITTGSAVIYLSGLQITDDFISVVLSSTAGIVASLTVKQNVVAHKNYVLNTFVSGVSGTIAFGHGALLERGVWHFASGKNMLDSACIRVIPYPVSSMAVKDKTPVTGRVIFSPGTDLVIEPCTVTLGDTRVKGYTTSPACPSGSGYKISLSPDALKRATSYSDQSAILRGYTGPCSMRPENDDCPYITSINGVEPDANGNITIKVKEGSVLQLNQILVEADTQSCGRTGSLYSNTFLLSSNTAFSNYTTSTPVRRCGRDLCDNESGSDDSGGSGGNVSVIEYDASWSIAAYARNVKIVQTDNNYGVVYASGVMSPAGNGPAYVYFSDKPKVKVSAGFNVGTNFECGIIYNLNKDNPGTLSIFKFNGTQLTLGNSVEDLSSPAHDTLVSLELMYSDKFTGTLNIHYASGVETYELDLSGEKSGLYGLYLQNCKCLMWNEI